jgi:hypothetical protein
MMTMSPALSVGSRLCSTPASAGAGSGEKADAVDRSVDDAGRLDPVATQGGQKGQRAPAAVRHLGDQPGAASATPMAAGHIGLGPGLVDEDQALGVKPALVLPPPDASPGDVGTVLFAGVQAFF